MGPPIPPRSEAPRRGRGAPRLPSVPHYHSAVDVDRLARHVIRVRAGQERDDVRNVLGPLRASERDTADPALPRFALAQSLERAPLLVDLLPHRGLDRAGTDTIRGDPLAGQQLG